MADLEKTTAMPSPRASSPMAKSPVPNTFNRDIPSSHHGHTNSSSISSVSSSLSTSFGIPSAPPGFIDPWKTTRKNGAPQSPDVRVDLDEPSTTPSEGGYFRLRSSSMSGGLGNGESMHPILYRSRLTVTGSNPNTPGDVSSGNKWAVSPDSNSLGLPWSGSSPWGERSKSIAVPISSASLRLHTDDPLTSPKGQDHASAEIHYRTQRSMSFAIGQHESDLFGYQPKREGSTGGASSTGFLPPMAEEDEYSQYPGQPKFRSRSKSSAAAFGLGEFEEEVGSDQHRYNEALLFQHQSPSSDLMQRHGQHNTPPTGLAPAFQGLSPERERLERLRNQRRYSLSPVPPGADYRLLEGSNQEYKVLPRPDLTDAEMAQLGIRRHSVAAPGQGPSNTPTSSASDRYLAESLENLHLDESSLATSRTPYLTPGYQTHQQQQREGTSPGMSYGNLMEDVNDYFENDTHRRLQVSNALAAQQAAAAAAIHQQRQHSQSPFGSAHSAASPQASIPLSAPLFIVEFKAGRSDLFYLSDVQGHTAPVTKGDLVVVEADRGKDLGKVVQDSVTPYQLQAFQQRKAAAESSNNMFGDGGNSSPKDAQPKRLYRLAQPPEVATLMAKAQDEQKALLVCQTKVRQRRLPMEVVDAEYQWDRRKLTFYFVAERRIDFRELVRDLFKIYKTRIWMMSTQRGIY